METGRGNGTETGRGNGTLAPSPPPSVYTKKTINAFFILSGVWAAVVAIFHGVLRYAGLAGLSTEPQLR